MTRHTGKTDRHRKRRRRLARTLFWGAAAVGVPALANVIIARRNRRLESPTWGRSRRFSWRHGEVDFQELGDGKPVVLVHSLGPGHDAEQWQESGIALSQEHRIFALDLLGWGLSDKPAVGYDGETYIRLLSDFLDQVVRQRAVIVAAGLSAAYAVQVAIDNPDMVAAVGLVGPMGLEMHDEDPDLTDALTNRFLRLPVFGASALNVYTSRAVLTRQLRKEMFAAEDRVDAARIEHHYQSSHQPGSHLALAALLSGYLNHDIRSLLARLDTPAWLAWGRQSRNPSVESADLWLSRLSNAELEVFEETGSHPHVETPARFAEALGSFLTRIQA